MESLTLRATGPQLPDELINTIAVKLPVTRLEPNNYPEAGAFTATRIASVLCGHVDTAYLKELTSRNALTASDLSKPLGQKVYSIEWPACLWVKNLQTRNTYNVKPGDTLSAIRLRFTGVPGTPRSNAHFFDLPEADPSRITVGQPLKIPYVTLATTFKAVPDKVTLADLAHAAAEISPTGNANEYFHTLPPRSTGQIVTFVQSGNPQAAVEPDECKGAHGPPFDPAKVAAAYHFAQGRALTEGATTGTVSLLVVDNGFFGARPSGRPDAFNFSKHFPRYYFDTNKFGAGLGPTFDAPASGGGAPTPVNPINFLNGLSHPDDLSGHGTHVTGLILGGPKWSPYEDTVFGAAANSRIRIGELNIGRGSVDLIPGAEQELARRIGMLATPRIINMSISFPDSITDVPDSFSFMDTATQTHDPVPHLYVVAAGNDHGDAVNYFPAALGGNNNASVLTVAALDAHDALAEFTNKGQNVDVAARGCNIESWIDDGEGLVALSGTSQAAPTVTFEATLIESLTTAAAAELKSRIIVSGDLLGSKDEKDLANPVAVNVQKALYLFDDYVRYHDKDGVHELLGLIRLLSGVSCQKTGPLRGDLVRAYKTDGNRSFAFYSRAKAYTVQICPGQPATGNGKLVVRVDFNITAAGYTPALLPPTNSKTIALSDVEEVVRRGPPLQGSGK
jgi:subtilisin family serine protease